ncbi:helix-turn-helix domain-containing protein [Paenibacillus alginolyticus]|uniref:Helix-turn-helix domain-containing protein n=1 Tax=Paenibacillus alginolyticus TaxID=59839 RepID=A0ABT4GM87_9BACL|nr:helix-turn-helix domain-containing protein [Paenibacillus alginolyticus]MCY9697336.1 helix-turn-helix domain-containing protein [Paenibacillus alginolyticus]MEC0145245.1 helix-turn-helix domain-containing protein [Paenibacillus alginolyticus]
MNNYSDLSFEFLIEKIFKEELSSLIVTLQTDDQTTPRKTYLTIKEVSDLTGIGTYTLRQLTYARAMPHRLVKSRIIFDKFEITETIAKYKDKGWTDPESDWDVKLVQDEIKTFAKSKESPLLIENIIRNIIKEELFAFSDEILKQTKKNKESYYGRTVLTIKEAADHFRTSPATIYSLVKEEGMPHLKIQSRFYIVLEEAESFLWRETALSYASSGNVYWQRILQRLDWEEKERSLAYEKALKRLESKE